MTSFWRRAACTRSCTTFSSMINRKGQRRRRNVILQSREDQMLERLQLCDAALEDSNVLVDGFGREVAGSEGVDELLM